MPEIQHTAMVLTALPLEYDAVCKHLVDIKEEVHPEGTWITRGQLPDSSWQVALAEVGEGVVTTAVLTERIVSWLAPDVLFFVGVAGSLKDDIAIGDVVVATKVYGIHGGKQTPEGFMVRPEAWRSSHRLEQVARHSVRGKAHLKPIAVGDVVLADSKSAIAEHLRLHYNDAAAIEMEGSGIAQAAHLSGHLDALVIRGISDHANAGKADADATGSQQKAADQAAEALVAILRKLPLFTRRSMAPGDRDTQKHPKDGVQVPEGTAPGPARAAGDTTADIPHLAQLLDALKQQIGSLLSEDEHALLAQLAHPASGSLRDRADLRDFAEAAAAGLPHATTPHVVSVVRSLIARKLLLPGPDGSHLITDAALRALARRRIP
ncbi:5'-methylthioadenosine/S-adenosylhomocysteine nucleosidase [Streptomyces albogriseolus]|uniref:5'-methylthioadenosine/S-adenosylhomocysteine nucleosidase n=1 Tax=Streptomyces TaxID=1883 RepID=UPI002A74B2DF|nr:5'-methylthioadenosine/S-adenosylhomocysteine nucleosidase [Streptomyces sp. CL7]WPP32100.1 5'-methylthioadenosine/S-adenosylhomocysteine nucleosidase [Streptomyces sp. CL7]